jgi:hypothetical protein
MKNIDNPKVRISQFFRFPPFLDDPIDPSAETVKQYNLNNILTNSNSLFIAMWSA